MASKKQWYSVVAATALAASFTMSGCGSSGGSSGSSSSVASSTSSNASSSSAGPVIVKVSDAYVLSANVTAGSAQAIEVGNGDYEFNTSISGTLMAEGGANDIDGDGNATAADPKAPTLKAPEGYTNINPFTTLVANGVADVNTTFPNAAAYPTQSGMQFDFDVVAVGDADNNGSIDIAKETAKAALYASGYAGDGVSSSSMPTSSSSESNSSAGTSSSVYNPFPAAARADDCVEVFPGDCAVSSSSEAASSEDSNASSSSEAAGGSAFSEIDACTTNVCIDDVVKTYMGDLNGYFGDEESSSSSSEESNTSSSSDMNTSSSSSVYNPFPAPEL